MKTFIIMEEEWDVVEEYDFLIPLSKGDFVDINGIEFIVDCCILNIDENRFEVLIKSR